MRTLRLALFVAIFSILDGSATAQLAQVGALWDRSSPNAPSIPGAEVANLIDLCFNDGTPGDGIVDSNIIAIFDMCYSGNWRAIFNGVTGESIAGGPEFDVISFSDTTRMTKQAAPGEVSYADTMNIDGNVLVALSKVLKPGVGVTAMDVFDAGQMANNNGGAADYNTGSIEGPAFRLVGGLASTHLLYWASKPEAKDLVAIDELIANFPNSPPTMTRTILAGTPAEAASNPKYDGPATKAALATALCTIGALMNPDEQFIFIVGDHGSTAVFDTSPKTIPPSGSDTASWSFNGGETRAFKRSLLTPSIPTVTFRIEYWVDGSAPLPFDPADVAVDGRIDGGPPAFLGTLDTWTRTSETAPDGTPYEVFEWVMPTAVAEAIIGQLPPDASFTVSHDIYNWGGSAVPFRYLMNAADNVPEVPVTFLVPAAGWQAKTLLVLTIIATGASLTLRSRRRAR